MNSFNVWLAPVLIAAALVLVSAIYVVVRWRRAPAAFRAIASVASVCLFAGFLLGLCVFHFWISRSSVPSRAEPTASPLAAARLESTPLSFPTARPARSIQTAIYVASPDRVTTYALGSNGNVRPLTTISGAACGLSDASAIAVDARGNIYVVNKGYGPKVRINIYAPGSTGDVIPARTISGPATDMHEPSGIAVSEDGRIYITNGFWGDVYITGEGNVAVYPSGSNGNVAPIARIIGRDYAKDFPHYWIYRPVGLGLDPRGGLYVLNQGNEGIAKLRVNSNGRTPPLNRIAGPMTGLYRATGIAIDSQGRLFVTDAEANSIMEYAADARGNAAPIATISGPSTQLSEPSGITLDADRNIYVTNHVASRLRA